MDPHFRLETDIEEVDQSLDKIERLCTIKNRVFFHFVDRSPESTELVNKWIERTFDPILEDLEENLIKRLESDLESDLESESEEEID
jgi:hypothetical protein